MPPVNWSINAFELQKVTRTLLMFAKAVGVGLVSLSVALHSRST